MSKKIEIETLKYILARNIDEQRTVAGILNEIDLELQAEEAEKEEKPPPIKKQFVVLVSDPLGALVDKDLVGWVLQIPEDSSVATAAERIRRAAYEYNTTPKGARMRVRTIGEACEVVPARFLKGEDVWVKTKTPVMVVPVRNFIAKRGWVTNGTKNADAKGR